MDDIKLIINSYKMFEKDKDKIENNIKNNKPNILKNKNIPKVKMVSDLDIKQKIISKKFNYSKYSTKSNKKIIKPRDTSNKIMEKIELQNKNIKFEFLKGNMKLFCTNIGFIEQRLNKILLYQSLLTLNKYKIYLNSALLEAKFYYNQKLLRNIFKSIKYLYKTRYFQSNKNIKISIYFHNFNLLNKSLISFRNFKINNYKIIDHINEISDSEELEKTIDMNDKKENNISLDENNILIENLNYEKNNTIIEESQEYINESEILDNKLITSNNVYNSQIPNKDVDLKDKVENFFNNIENKFSSKTPLVKLQKIEKNSFKNPINNNNKPVNKIKNTKLKTNLQKIEENIKKSKQRREEINKKKELIKLKKQEELRLKELEDQKKLNEKKINEIKKLKDKRKKEEELKLLKKNNKENFIKNMKIAKDFYIKISKNRIFQTLKILYTQYKNKNLYSNTIYKNSLLNKCFICFKKEIEKNLKIKIIKENRSKNFYNKLLYKKFTFYMRLYKKIYYDKIWIFYKFKKEKIFLEWYKLFKLNKEIDTIKLIKNFKYNFYGKLFLKKWQFNSNNNKYIKEKEKRKGEIWGKINGWLKDYEKN